MLQLDFLQFQSAIQLRQGTGAHEVFDPIRRKWLVLTPEEMLRQLVLQYLLLEKQYPPHRIRTEIGIQVNGMARRCDIVVFDTAVKPWLLVECKSPKVPLQQAALDQAARYNLTLGVPFLSVTNGLETACFALPNQELETIQFLNDFPEFPFTRNL
jgi:Type I restriction enzyme R protein N terminus (HSDR_N)